MFSLNMGELIYHVYMHTLLVFYGLQTQKTILYQFEKLSLAYRLLNCYLHVYIFMNDLL